MNDYDNETYDNDEDDVHNTAYISDENTYDSTTPGSKLDRLNRELVEDKIRDLEKKFRTSIPVTEHNRFRLFGKDLLFEKSDGQYVSLTNSRSGKFLEPSGIRGRLGASLAHELLNIETPKKDKAQAHKLLKAVDIEMDDLSTGTRS